MAENRLEDLFTDSEDELPGGWEMRVADNGRVFYVDHGNKFTQWGHPSTGREKFLPADLPFGWVRSSDEKGSTVFIDEVNDRRTCVDPRIAYAMTDKKKAQLKFDADSTAMAVLRGRDLRGKTALVTGASCGIGFEAALALSLHGCHVILACRDREEGEKTAIKIRNKQVLSADVDIVQCDLSSLDDVKKCAEYVIFKKWPIHMLICNAGVMELPYTLSVDGIEKTFAVNHLGHFYLTDLLKDVLKKCAPSRVVVVSSESHRYPSLYGNTLDISSLPIREHDYESIVAYNQSKLCNLLFTFELNRRLSSSGVFCNAVHPGNFVYTNIQRNSYLCRLLHFFLRPFSKSQAQGAATVIYCATSLEMEGVGGYYFNNCCGCIPSDLAQDETLAKNLWWLSEKLVYGNFDSSRQIGGLF